MLIVFLMIFSIFSNIIFRFDFIPSYFSYWDELLVICLIGLWVYNLIRNKGRIKIKKKDLVIIVGILLLVIIGVIGNIKWRYIDSVKGILVDIMGVSKFFITLFIVRNIYSEKSYLKKIKRYCIPFLKIMCIIILIFGILSLYFDLGMSQSEIRYWIRPYYFLFTHPTAYVLANVLILSILNMSDENIGLYDLIITINILLSMRTKGIIVIFIYIYMKYIGKKIKKYRLMYLSGGGFVAILMILQKLKEYSLYSSTSRGTLYEGAFELLKKCFPIGSGLATYASHVSGSYGSKVYDFIYIDWGWIDGKATSVLGDAGFAYYIGQFGILGSLIFIIMLVTVLKMCFISKKNTDIATIILYIYIIIALMAESILLNNGFELGLIFAVGTIVFNEKIQKV